MNIRDDVRAFAELCARFEEPFADRGALLAAAGASVTDWLDVRERWRERFAEGNERAAALGRAFSEAYVAQRDGKGSASRAPLRGPAGMPVPLPFTEMTAPIITTAPPPPRVGSMTEDVSLIIKAVLPFNPNAPSASAIPSMKPGKTTPPPSGETVDIGVVKDCCVWPFGLDPMRAAAPGRAARRRELPLAEAIVRLQAPPEERSSGALPSGATRRFVRFDPQTGLPLANPYWEELRLKGEET